MPPKPIVLSDHQRNEVETLAALLNQEQIADYFGIGRTTFHHIMKRDPDVAERYKRGKAKAIAHVANGLLQKARSGCTTSSIFYLKTQAGWRETGRIEHAMVSGRIDAMTDAELEEAIRACDLAIAEIRGTGPVLMDGVAASGRNIPLLRRTCE